jgi:hypothetical protein
MFVPVQNVQDGKCQNVVVFITITLGTLSFVIAFRFLISLQTHFVCIIY